MIDDGTICGCSRCETAVGCQVSSEGRCRTRSQSSRALQVQVPAAAQAPTGPRLAKHGWTGCSLGKREEYGSRAQNHLQEKIDIVVVAIVKIGCSIIMVQLDIFKSVLNINLLTKRLKMLLGSSEEQNIYL